MEFLLGALGCIAVLILIAAGLVVGWSFKNWQVERTQLRTAKELDEEERKRLIQQQEAFRLVQNYTPEHAYGMYSSVDKEKSGEE